MVIYNSIEEFAKTGYECDVALGFFDGAHLGHRAVIGECVKKSEGGVSAVLTFRDSPSKLLRDGDVLLITDNRRKAELLAGMGVDAVIFADFTQIKDMDTDRFVTRVLHEQLRAEKVCCGYNYRFGRHGAGDTETLKRLCAALGIEVVVKDPIRLNGQTVSSTAIRKLLSKGDIAGADAMLGYAYTVRGQIGSGNHIGHKMGYPTVNIPIGEGLIIPRYGVYASRIAVGGKTYRGATNIGVHPTVGANSAPLCETFLLDYSGEELYGEDAICEPVAFIRPEQRFASLEELTAQVGRDIKRIKETLR